MSRTISTRNLFKLPDWSRVYSFNFGKFLELSSGSLTVASRSFTPPSGLTCTDLGMFPGFVAKVRIAGGTAGTTYSLSYEITLSNGTILSIPGSLSVVNPSQGAVPPTTLYKRVDWKRYYRFRFDQYFSEFSASPPPNILSSPAPVFTCSPAADSSVLVNGTPTISGSNVIVALSQGNADQTYSISCKVTLSSGDVLSLPGIIGVSA